MRVLQLGPRCEWLTIEGWDGEPVRYERGWEVPSGEAVHLVIDATGRFAFTSAGKQLFSSPVPPMAMTVDFPSDSGSVPNGASDHLRGSFRYTLHESWHPQSPAP